MKRSLPLLLALLSPACGGEGSTDDPISPSAPVVIAPLTGLVPMSGAEDPLKAHRPETLDCNNLSGWYIEEGILEANTAECNYLALVEPAANAARAGEVVKTELSYFDLTAPEEAEAHIALLVEDDIIWEQTIAIPGDAKRLELSIELSRDIPEGAPIGIHLHNHGQNTWNLSPLTVVRTSEE